jgi:hypothetical protein
MSIALRHAMEQAGLLFFEYQRRDQEHSLDGVALQRLGGEGDAWS